MNPKAQALNKAQQQLRPELYFPEFLNRGSAHLTDSSKKSENREEVIANNNTGLVKSVKIQNNKKQFADLCCAKNITEYRTNKKLLADLCCAKIIVMMVQYLLIFGSRSFRIVAIIFITILC